MNARSLAACFGIALVFGGCVAADPPPKPAAAPPSAAAKPAADSAPKAAATTASAPVKATLAQLDWLAGAWGGQKRGADIEEHWMSPKGGMMVGMHRDVLPKGDSEYEFLRVEQMRDGSLVYLAGPGGIEPTEFKAVEVGDRRVVFENRLHDFPQRIIYWREGGDLLARIEGENEGEKVIVDWRFAPLKPVVK